MGKLISKTGERIIPEKFESTEEYLIYLRHLFAYQFVKANIPKNALVLEVGCGEGYGTHILSKGVKKIIGIDIDKNTVLHASHKYGTENCIFKLYNGIKIPYPNNTFDAVISFQVIEHVNNDLAFVSEIYRVLKKGGVFILTTPNRTYRLKPGQKPWNRFHKREYYPSELEEVLRSRFSDVNVWGICGNDEIQRIEIQRVKQSQAMVSLDPMNLRRLIPEPIKPAIIRLMRKIIPKRKKPKATRVYSIKDFYVIKDNVKNSLDLLGICKK